MKHAGLMVAFVMAAALVALFGFFTYSLGPPCGFGCTNKAVTMPYAVLYSSNDTFVFNSNNPYSATTIASVQISLANSTSEYNCGVQSSFVPSGLSYHSCHVNQILTNQTMYNYVINYGNGDSDAGSITAQ